MILLAALFTISQAPDSIDLVGALARARTSRTHVIAAGALVTRARGALSAGSIIPNPTVQLEFDDLFPTRKLTATQPLSWLLRRGADRAAGQAGVRRAAADSVQLLADLARDVRRAFFASLAARERARLADEQVAIADSAAKLAERRVSAGDISVLERDQVAQEAARARQAASRVRETALTARMALARAIAWAGAQPPNPRGFLDLGLDSVVVQSAPEVGEVSALPSVRAAVADSIAAAARLQAARLAQMPLPSVLVGREWGGVPSTQRDNLILGLAMPIPIWNQGGALVHEARGVATLSAVHAVETRLEMSLQLSNARIHLAESAARARIARDSILPAAQRIRSGALRLYEAERTGILSVFEALRTERDAAQSTVDELLAFQEARADLAAILGQW